MGRSLAAIQQWPLLKNNTTTCRSGGQHGQLRKWCVPTASRPPQDKCILMAPCLRGWHRSTSKANAASGWPQRVAPAYGSHRKFIVAEKQQYPHPAGIATRPATDMVCPQDCRIRNSATFAERMCPHTPRNGVSPRTRCVPTALGPLGWEGLPHVKGECRQWVAPASSLGMRRASVICRLGKTTTLASRMQPPYRIVVEVVCPRCPAADQGNGVSPQPLIARTATDLQPEWCVPAALPPPKELVCPTALGQTDSDRRAVGVVCPHGQRD